MAYFPKYYMEFVDYFERVVRVTILDSEGAAPTEPYQLTASAAPLLEEIMNSSDEKEALLMGKQVTINWIYTGGVNEPTPEIFFEADERRFRVEITKNGILSGVYYVRPDGCETPYLHDPYELSVTAVDGLAYAEGTDFNMFGLDELLVYDKITLYEAILTRALHLVVDDTQPMYVLNSLLPTNIESGVKLLFGTYVHTDAFYDFVSGAKSVKEVLEMFCLSFGCRLFLEDGAIWWQRIEDTNTDVFNVEQYTSDVTSTTVSMPLARSLGPSAFYDGIPINANAIKRTTPALKRLDAETKYRSINFLENFDWRTWDGTNFASWQNALELDLERVGSGTIEDPYQAFLPYNTANNAWIAQILTNTGDAYLSAGDIVELDFKFVFNNTKSWDFLLYLAGTGGDFVLGSGGDWSTGPGALDRQVAIRMSRSGRKRNGSFKIKSQPIPGRVGTINFIFLFLMTPSELSDTPDNANPNGIFLSPVKLGAISFSSEGRHITAINNARFTRVKEGIEFNFIDTGDDGISNTLFTTDDGAVPVDTWTTSKPEIPNKDIERFMAEAYINQAQRSVLNWEGDILGQDIGLKSTYTFSAIPGKKFIKISDRVDEKQCTHAVVMQEVFVEGTASISYSEYDIEEDAEEE